MIRKKNIASSRALIITVCLCVTAFLLYGCAPPPQRQYFMVNYIPPQMNQRTMQNPYACVIRLREFSIEEAYNRPQIIYRLNPFELRYYHFKSWAVKPTRMVTDLFFKHLNSVQLVGGIARRLDEGGKPDYEISGFIEAIEEYDNEDMLFAHIAIRLNMMRFSDRTTVYSRNFDLRRKVLRRETEFVIKEMSQILEFVFTEVIADIDKKLAVEFGITDTDAPPTFMPIQEPSFSSDITDDVAPKVDGDAR